MSNQFYQTQLPRREDCLSHETYPEPCRLPLSSPRDTADTLFSALRGLATGAGRMRLVLDRDLLVGVSCPSCHHHRRVLRPVMSATHDALTCAQCGRETRLEVVHAVEEGSELSGLTLAALGVPRYDIVRVETERGDHFVLLADDRHQPDARTSSP